MSWPGLILFFENKNLLNMSKAKIYYNERILLNNLVFDANFYELNKQLFFELLCFIDRNMSKYACSIGIPS